MGRPSREAQILDAALACFAELGYDATRVRHIAARAGVSDAALYRHHASKEAVAEALFATHMRRFSVALERATADPADAVADRIRAIAFVSLELRWEEPDAYAFVLGHQDRFMRALPADFPYPIHRIEQLLHEGQGDGSVRPGSVRVLAALVLGCINYPAIVAQHGRPGTIELSEPATMRLIADGAWAAIAARPPAVIA
jgi:AcrR family transcriptional regulator